MRFAQGEPYTLRKAHCGMISHIVCFTQGIRYTYRPCNNNPNQPKSKEEQTMAIRTIEVKNFERPYPTGVLAKVEQLASTILASTFYDLKGLRIFNMNGAQKRYHAGNRDSVTIFLNATPNTSAPKVPRDLNMFSTFFGIEVAHGQRLNHVQADDIQNLLTPEGEVFGSYIKGDHDIYIHHDFQQYPNEKHLELLKVVFTYIKEQILDKKGMENSWIHTADKESLLHKFKKRIIDQNARNLEDDKYRLNDFQEKVTRYQRDLKSGYDNIARLMKTISAVEAGEVEVTDKLVTEMNNIANHPRITDLRIENEFITVTIPDVVAVDKKERSFYIGTFQVKINTSNSEVKFFGDNPRRSHWTSTDPHPHVNGRNGQACLGNVASTIAELCSQNEMYALVMTCIDFLENANIDDSAGKHVTNWDLMNSDGTRPTSQVAQQTQEAQIRCDRCDNVVDIDEEDMYTVFTSYDGDGDVSVPQEWCDSCNGNYTMYDERIDMNLSTSVYDQLQEWYGDEEEEGEEF